MELGVLALERRFHFLYRLERDRVIGLAVVELDRALDRRDALELVVDAAAVIAAIEACTGTKCETIVGKPDPVMLHACLEGLDIDLANCVMVGDRLSTDIRMALDAGMVAALVLTGETSINDLEHLSLQDMPNFVLEHIDQLLPLDTWQNENPV